MSKKYEAPKETGREYVDKTTEFCNYTHDRCDLLPKRWKDSYLLPLINIADDIESCTRCANKIYINESNMQTEDLIAAYGKRIEQLTTAVSLFADFDIKFERLMGKIDIAGSEKRRLASVLRSIIDQEKKADPNVSRIEIKVVSHMDEMEYVSMNGDKCMKLRLLSKNRDSWLRYEAAALDYIRKRIAYDKKAVSRLSGA